MVWSACLSSRCDFRSVEDKKVYMRGGKNSDLMYLLDLENNYRCVSQLEFFIVEVFRLVKTCFYRLVIFYTIKMTKRA